MESLLTLAESVYNVIVYRDQIFLLLSLRVENKYLKEF